MPLGIGEQRPNNYLEIWSALRENRESLRYAWLCMARRHSESVRVGDQPSSVAGPARARATRLAVVHQVGQLPLPLFSS
jgi:hypothetical protein